MFFAIANPSVAYNVRAPLRPTHGVEMFGNISSPVYLGHPVTSVQNFTEIVPGEPLSRRLNVRGIATCTYVTFGYLLTSLVSEPFCNLMNTACCVRPKQSQTLSESGHQAAPH